MEMMAGGSKEKMVVVYRRGLCVGTRVCPWNISLSSFFLSLSLSKLDKKGETAKK